MKKENTGKMLTIIIVLVMINLVTYAFMEDKINNPHEEINYTEFREMIDKNKVKEVEFKTGKIFIKSKDNKDYQTLPVKDDSLVDIMLEKDIQIKSSDDISSKQTLSIIIDTGINLLYLGLIYTFIKKSGIFSQINGDKKHKEFQAEKVDNLTTFDNVFGQEEAKEDLMEILDLFINNDKYKKIGAKLPSGILLTGPPGTGKTLMAKALAGEINKSNAVNDKKISFYNISGSDFVEMYVGVGAKRVRELFEDAKKNAPSIIFIDEIDAIGSSRMDGGRGGHSEKDQTLNKLLTEMDGFNSQDKLDVFVIAATNKPESLDKALLRAGRFDRKIVVNYPDKQGRLDTITNIAKNNYQMDDDFNPERIAAITPGASGADIATMFNEAAIVSVAKGKNKISQSDLEAAVEDTIAGSKKKNQILSDKEKWTVSVHEVGHAAMILEENTAPLQKITIIPRTKGALGFTMQAAEHEKVLYSKKDLIKEVKVLLGGRAAEEVFFDEITTGASDDINRATKIIRELITVYGMSDQFGVMNIDSVNRGFLGDSSESLVSEQTKYEVDKAVKLKLSKIYQETVEDIKRNKDKIQKLSEDLYEKETIDGDVFAKKWFSLK